MKTIAILLLVAIVGSAVAEPIRKGISLELYKKLLEHSKVAQKDGKEVLTVDMNEYLDNILKLVRVWIIQNGLDPMQAEDIEKGFSVKIGFITYHGEFSLKHGWVQELSTVARGGDATMDYEAQFLNMKLPLFLETVMVNFDYRAKIMNLGPSGGVEGKIKNLKIFVDIMIDTKNGEIILQDFKITDAGKISIRFSGNPLVDWLTNVLTGLATSLLHGVVTGVIENQVRDLVEQTIDDVNNALHPPSYYYQL